MSNAFRRPAQDEALPEPGQRRDGPRDEERAERHERQGAVAEAPVRVREPRARPQPAPEVHEQQQAEGGGGERAAERGDGGEDPLRDAPRDGEHEHDGDPAPPVEPAVDDLGPQDLRAALARSPSEVLHAEEVAAARRQQRVEHGPDDLSARYASHVAQARDRAHDRVPAQRLEPEHDERRADAADHHRRRGEGQLAGDVARVGSPASDRPRASPRAPRSARQRRGANASPPTETSIPPVARRRDPPVSPLGSNATTRTTKRSPAPPLPSRLFRAALACAPISWPSKAARVRSAASAWRSDRWSRRR